MSESEGICLIVGLGNPGEEYQATRHNAGFWFVDAVAKREGATFARQAKVNGDVARFTFQDKEIWLFKPLAYMNESGATLRTFTDFYDIPMRQVLVVYDEIDIPNGMVKLKWAGGHGGHNGLRSIFSHLGKDFWRLRIGVGHPGRKDDVTGYVLSVPNREEFTGVVAAIEHVLAILGDLLQGKADAVMKTLHTHTKD